MHIYIVIRHDSFDGGKDDIVTWFFFKERASKYISTHSPIPDFPRFPYITKPRFSWSLIKL